MHDDHSLLSARVKRVLEQRIVPAQTRVVAPLDVAAWPVPDGADGVPGQGEPVDRRHGLDADYQPFTVPGPWGPGWGTTWFRLTGQVPAEARQAHLELSIDLGGGDQFPGFHCEAMVYRPDGSIIKALNPDNRWIPCEQDADGRVEVFLEAASNPPMMEGTFFAPTQRGDKRTVGPAPLFGIMYAAITQVNDETRSLVADLRCLTELAETLPANWSRRNKIELGIDAALDELDLADIPGTAAACRAALRPLLDAPAAPSAHQISAVGHAHIDSAWLWPIRETRRKVGRTIANVLRLIDDGEPLVFVLPAAQHVAWLKTDYPDLFDRLKQAVADGQVIPVGGMWVEPDANLPGGEAMCRQLAFGIRYFEEQFGIRCRGVWLPDSFGYSASLPQLARAAGMDWFLTQKLSWNQVDDFPHHTFWWEGLDGTRIFTHFPPVDTYNATLSGEELAHAATSFRDKGRSDRSLVPFGHGDGGGGPTREMLWQARRVADLEGSPTVTIEGPDEFFAKALAEYPDAPVWVGELYLELHRGTFTSQAATKAGNRHNEALLDEAELWSTYAAVRGLVDYPYDELRACWEQVLLGQFHDILPGSSIAQVHREIVASHAEVTRRLEAIIDERLTALVGDGEAEVVTVARPIGPGALAGATPFRSAPEVSGEETDDAYLIENDFMRVTVAKDTGLVTSLYDLMSNREVIPAGQFGNLLQLHSDYPNQWDAWDIDAHYRNRCTDITGVAATEFSADAEVATIKITREFGASTAVQELTVRRGVHALEIKVDVDWHEQEKLLKLAWPLDIHTDIARFESQFGYVTRHTHENTSWDAARFEVNAHRWVFVGEPGYAVSLANECTYGWDVTRHVRSGGGTFSTVRGSLLRGARYPDPQQDQGRHTFRFRLRPSATLLTTYNAGYRATTATRHYTGTPFAPLVRADGHVIVSAVKLADDRSGDVVVRLYEPMGARAEATLNLDFDIASIVETDLLEVPLDGESRIDATAVQDSAARRVELVLRPFQVVTLRLRRA